MRGTYIIKKTIHFVELTVHIAPALILFLVYPLSVSTAQEYNPEIQKALMNALPRQSDFPGGLDYNWKYASRRAHPGSAYMSVMGRLFLRCSTNQIAPKDTYDMRCYTNFFRQPKDADAMKRWLYSGSGYKPYNAFGDGLGSIFEEKSKDGLRCFIRFFKNRSYGAQVTVSVRVITRYDTICRPSYSERYAKARSIYRTECERLARLVWSRLPGEQVPVAAPAPAVTRPGTGTEPSVQAQPDGAPAGGIIGPSPGQTPTRGISNTALPMAAGAAAGVAAVGALATLLAQGIPIREGLGELMALFRGAPVSVSPEQMAGVDPGLMHSAYPDPLRGVDPEPLDGISLEPLSGVDPEPLDGTSLEPLDGTAMEPLNGVSTDPLSELSPDPIAGTFPPQDPSPDHGTGFAEKGFEGKRSSGEASDGLSFEERQKEDIAYEEAWRKFKEERGEYEYGSTAHTGDQMEKVREEMAQDAAGTISDFDRTRLDMWIEMNAPTEQAAEDMRRLVQTMAVETGDGRLTGDFEEIRKALGQELQRTNQPDLRYLEKYALRDEIMEKAPVLGRERELYSDYASVAGDDIDKAVAFVSDYVKYVEGYNAAYEGHPYMAHGKAAVQMGVKYIAGKNPAMAVADTPLKYLTYYTMGQDKSPSKFLEFHVNTFFDAATGELGDKPIAALDFSNPEVTGKIYTSQMKGIEARLENPNLSSGERRELTGLLTDMKDEMSKFKEE